MGLPDIDAWVIGHHSLPIDVPESLLTVDADGNLENDGRILIRDHRSGSYSVLTRGEFDREYEWLYPGSYL